MTDARIEFIRRCLDAEEQHIRQDAARAREIRTAWGLPQHEPTGLLSTDSRMLPIEAHREIVDTCEHYLHEYESGIDPCANGVLDALVAAYREHSFDGRHPSWGPT